MASRDRKSTRLNSSHPSISYAVFCLKKKKRFPLFITEGNSKWKLSRIKRNDYLRFCYEKLAISKNGLVLIWHSLHKDYDQHIIDAILQSESCKVAIGVWPHQDGEEIIALKFFFIIILQPPRSTLFPYTTLFR